MSNNVCDFGCSLFLSNILTISPVVCQVPQVVLTLFLDTCSGSSWQRVCYNSSQHPKDVTSCSVIIKKGKKRGGGWNDRKYAFVEYKETRHQICQTKYFIITVLLSLPPPFCLFYSSFLYWFIEKQPYDTIRCKCTLYNIFTVVSHRPLLK